MNVFYITDHVRLCGIRDTLRVLPEFIVLNIGLNIFSSA